MKPNLLDLYQQVLPASHLQLSEDEYQSLRSNGNLIFANRSLNIYIPQIPIRTFQEFFDTIDHLKKTAASRNLKIFFRGQTRDYYDKDKCLSTLPTAYREGVNSPFGPSTDMKEINNKLIPWIRFMESKGIKIGDYFTFNAFNDGTYKGVLRFTETDDFSESFFNLSVIGLLQHYGFPTYFIDLSSNELVSLWFALNSGQEMPDGKIKMRHIKNRSLPKKWKTAIDLEKWPTLHIYLHSQADDYWSIYDLRSIEELKSIGLRPAIQEALVMPYRRNISFKLPIPNHTFYEYIDLSLDRWPNYILKIGFDISEFKTAFPKFTRNYLLPDEDILYQQILLQKLPCVTIFD